MNSYIRTILIHSENLKQPIPGASFPNMKNVFSLETYTDS